MAFVHVCTWLSKFPSTNDKEVEVLLVDNDTLVVRTSAVSDAEFSLSVLYSLCCMMELFVDSLIKWFRYLAGRYYSLWSVLLESVGMRSFYNGGNICIKLLPEVKPNGVVTVLSLKSGCIMKINIVSRNVQNTT